MISERELRRIAARIGVGVGQTEHQYAMLCVLDALSYTPPLSDTFCLKGGTALRLVYFGDWRHSVDLDFSVLPAFPSEELRARSTLVRKCRHKRLCDPSARAFLLPDQLAEARVYWEQDLAGQVPADSLPRWESVTRELATLLAEFFADKEYREANDGQA